MLLFILWVARRTYGLVLSRPIAGVASATAISGLVVNLPRYKKFNEYFHEYVSAGEFIGPIPISCGSFAYYWPWQDIRLVYQYSTQPIVHVSG
jgi:hypothetical protein